MYKNISFSRGSCVRAQARFEAVAVCVSLLRCCAQLETVLPHAQKAHAEEGNNPTQPV